MLLLNIVVLLVLVNLINQKRFRSLFVLPYNNMYTITYNQSFLNIFNILLFITSNLTLNLFIYLLLQTFYPDKFLAYNYLYIHITILNILYWIIRYSLEFFVSYIFDLRAWQQKVTLIKMSYFFSSTLYLLIFLIFIIYTPSYKVTLLYITSAFYFILVVVRYYHFIRVYKNELITYLFYFILYLCALEIAPLLMAIKFGI